jgi:hypothetical protein
MAFVTSVAALTNTGLLPGLVSAVVVTEETLSVKSSFKGKYHFKTGGEPATSGQMSSKGYRRPTATLARRQLWAVSSHNQFQTALFHRICDRGRTNTHSLTHSNRARPTKIRAHTLDRRCFVGGIGVPFCERVAAMSGQTIHCKHQTTFSMPIYTYG